MPSETWADLWLSLGRKISIARPFFPPREVVTHLKATDKKSAAGVDGAKRDDLLAWDPEGKKLAKLYGSWLAAGYVPKCVKTARTVLLPKSTDQQS